MRTHTTSNETVEMYLKTIAELSESGAPATIAHIAERLQVTPVSANEMIKRLAEQDLVIHERYKGVYLTPDGLYIANNIIRRQRLWECFLVEHLKFNWAGVYETACRLEHATSSVLAESLAAFLGHPQTCPHGNPIPRTDGSVAKRGGCPLSSLKVGASGTIVSIAPTETEVYSYLSQHGIMPNRHVTVIERAPMDGPITIRLDTGHAALGPALVALITVQPV